MHLSRQRTNTPSSRTIIFLCTEINTFPNACIEGLLNLSTHESYQIYIYSWGVTSKKRIKPLISAQNENTFCFSIDNMSSLDILSATRKANPSIIVCSGWQEKKFLLACSYFKIFRGIPVVAAIDDKFTLTPIQMIKSVFRFIVSRLCYTNAWISGFPQYAFAVSCGFADKNITVGSLTGCQIHIDSHLFESDCNVAKRKYFLYIGNLRKIKGTDILFQAYKKYRRVADDPWDLVMIGNAVDIDPSRLSFPGITLLGYIENSKLLPHIASSSACLLPSRSDQWGIALHEYTQVGKPVIASLGCGSRHQFLINNYNGFTFNPDDTHDLSEKMLLMSTLSEEARLLMEERSFRLSQCMSSDISAYSLLSIMES